MSDDGGLPPGLTADVKALIDMMARGGIADLSLETASVKLRLRSGQVVGVVASAPLPAIEASVPRLDEADAIVIPAPMIGTFYRAPKPGEPNFVEVGDTIELGQTIGIIEAMKIMNEIAAEIAGTVAEILVSNGQPVEFGQPLLRLEPRPLA
ncbi:MAG: acetyl-CoA carboxylase biotin carboxyl carrier protein [Thermomicrobiales bacterium]